MDNGAWARPWRWRRRHRDLPADQALFRPPQRVGPSLLHRVATEAGHRLVRALNARAFDWRVAGRPANPLRILHDLIEERATGIDPRVPREYLGVLGAAARGTDLTTLQAPVFAARYGANRQRAHERRARGLPVDPYTPDGDTWAMTVPNLPLVDFGPHAVDSGYVRRPGPLLAIYCVKGKTALREVFTSPNFDRGVVPYHVLAQAIGTPSIKATDEAQGAGLFAGRMQKNATWRDDRRLSLRLVGARALDDLVPGMVAALDEIVAEIDAFIDAHPEQPIDGSVLMSRIAFRMILRAAFGPVHDARFDRMGEELRDALREVLRYFATARYFLDSRGMMEELAVAKRIFAELGARIRALHAEGALTPAQLEIPLLRYVLFGGDGDGPPDPPSDDRLYALLVPILFGGHETTGYTLAWVLYHLGLDPTLERRYLDELAAFRAERPGEVARPAFIEERPVQQALLYEIGRRYPPVVAAARTSTAAGEVGPDPDSGIGAFAYPAGALFLAEITAVHHDPERYPEPYTVDIDRWLRGTEALSRAEAGRQVRARYNAAEKGFDYILFGAGPAKCLGQAFNQLECNLILDALLERYRFELVHPERPVRPTRAAISGPEPGSIAVRIRRRRP